MSSGIGTPRACERVLAITPDSTVTGRAGGARRLGGSGEATWVAGLPSLAPGRHPR